MREILANPNGAAYFCDPSTFRGLMLAGRMEIVDDEACRQAYWRDEYRIYYTGPDDPDWVIVRLVPDTAAGWNGTEPFSFDPR
jgi:general stress protein 26